MGEIGIELNQAEANISPQPTDQELGQKKKKRKAQNVSRKMIHKLLNTWW